MEVASPPTTRALQNGGGGGGAKTRSDNCGQWSTDFIINHNIMRCFLSSLTSRSSVLGALWGTGPLQSYVSFATIV